MKFRLFKKTIPNLLALGILFTFSCCAKQGKHEICRTDALDNQAWESSTWISVVDAPVVTGTRTGWQTFWSWFPRSGSPHR